MPQMRAMMSGTSSKRPAAQQGLEQPRRLEDRQLHVLDAIAAQADVQAPFALDAGQGFDANGASARRGSLGLAMIARFSVVWRPPGDRLPRGIRERSR